MRHISASPLIDVARRIIDGLLDMFNHEMSNGL